MDKDAHLARSGPAEEDTERKRVAKPDPDPNVPDQRVIEFVSTVKCTMSAVVHDPAFRTLLSRLVVIVNAMTAGVSLLAKELLMTKLYRGEELPKLNQQFYSALYTSMDNGKWTHGHDALLVKRRVADPGLGSVMSQAVDLVGKKLAAETETHLRQHYEKFYRKWYKWTEQDDDEDDDENFPDPTPPSSSTWSVAHA